MTPITTEQVQAAAEAATFMSQQSLQWWFSALFLLFVISGGFVLWVFLQFHKRYIDGLTTQLSEQRIANQKTNDSLIQYVANDHVKSLETLRDVGAALREMSETLKETRSLLFRAQQHTDS